MHERNGRARGCLGYELQPEEHRRREEAEDTQQPEHLEESGVARDEELGVSGQQVKDRVRNSQGAEAEDLDESADRVHERYRCRLRE